MSCLQLVVSGEKLISAFTFALEQRKVYTVGRDKGCDIRFEGKTVKPLQGAITVGDWDPTNVRLTTSHRSSLDAV